jgi:hypothetical protein
MAELLVKIDPKLYGKHLHKVRKADNVRAAKEGAGFNFGRT